MMDRMTRDLNLTDTQKQQTQQIFQSARQSSEPVHAQLRQNRQALNAAAKSGASDAEIDKLAGNTGTLVGQTTAIHTKAMRQLYGILTPEQKQKLSDNMDKMSSQMESRRGWRSRQGTQGGQSTQPSPSR
jgi:Spy/CpxP family protein refolding chaperone